MGVGNAGNVAERRFCSYMPSLLRSKPRACHESFPVTGRSTIAIALPKNGYADRASACFSVAIPPNQRTRHLQSVTSPKSTGNGYLYHLAILALLSSLYLHSSVITEQATASSTLAHLASKPLRQACSSQLPKTMIGHGPTVHTLDVF